MDIPTDDDLRNWKKKLREKLGFEIDNKSDIPVHERYVEEEFVKEGGKKKKGQKEKEGADK